MFPTVNKKLLNPGTDWNLFPIYFFPIKTENNKTEYYELQP